MTKPPRVVDLADMRPQSLQGSISDDAGHENGKHRVSLPKAARRMRALALDDGRSGDLTVLEHAELTTLAYGMYRQVRRSAGTVLGAEVAQVLLATGLVLSRHAVQQYDEERRRLMHTATLIAATLLCARRTPSIDDVFEVPETTLDAWHQASYSHDLGLEKSETNASGQTAANGAICDAASHAMARATDRDMLEKAAQIYFACAAREARAVAMRAAVANGSLSSRLGVEGETHVTVDGALNDARALAIVDAADAELGQMAFRDLVVSFLMPRSSTRMRRTLLLDRATTRVAEAFHPEEFHWAHSAAMQMPSNAWRNGVIDATEGVAVSSDFLQDDAEAAAEVERMRRAAERGATHFVVERTCALLAGLAMIICGDEKNVRHGDAFGGLVELPFLVPGQVTASRFAERVPRIALVDTEWFYYSTPRHGSAAAGLRAHAQGVGVEGLLRCIVGFLDAYRA